MRPLSLDLRERVIAALQEGQTRPQIAQRFSVSVGSVGRLAKQWREQNHLHTRPITGRPRAISETQKEWLQALRTTQKDHTLESLAQAFEEKTGKKISLSALHRNLIWLGYSHKKSRALPKSKMPQSEPLSKKPLPK